MDISDSGWRPQFPKEGAGRIALFQLSRRAIVIIMQLRKRTLAGPFTLHRTLPRNIRPEEEWIFARELKRECEGIFLITGKHIMVDVLSGIAISGLSPVKESFVSAQAATGYHLARVAMQWLRLAKYREFLYCGPVLLIHDRFCHYYGHWMTDAVSRTYLARDYLETHKIILPASYRSHAYKLESLIPFGVSEKHIMYVDSPVALVKDFAMPSFAGPLWVNPKDEIAQAIREIYHEHFGLSDSKPKKLVYLTRMKMGHRHVINEDQVLELLTSKGFEVIVPEDMRLEEQARLLASTKVLIGLTGSALNNMMFMHPDSSVIEFRMKDDDQNLHYFSYSSAHQLKYYYIRCPSRGDDRFYADFVVDIDLLEETVDMALSN